MTLENHVVLLSLAVLVAAEVAALVVTFCVGIVAGSAILASDGKQ